MKQQYIDRIESFFKDKKSTKQLYIKQIETFYKIKSNYILPSHSYKLGDYVMLKKGTFMHGTRNILDSIDNLIETGIISPDLYKKYNDNQKTAWCANFWNIQNDIKLVDYIKLYSGATITYYVSDNNDIVELIPFGEIDNTLNGIYDKPIRMWSAEQTKENRFLPCLSNNKVQMAFIINTDNDEAKSLIKNDIFDLSFDGEILKSILSEKTGEDFIKNNIYGKRTALSTNRESAVIFGLPACFIEGILVGKEYESNTDKLDLIKSKLPKCYICNLAGKVIKE